MYLKIRYFLALIILTGGSSFATADEWVASERSQTASTSTARFYLSVQFDYEAQCSPKLKYRLISKRLTRDRRMAVQIEIDGRTLTNEMWRDDIYTFSDALPVSALKAGKELTITVVPEGTEQPMREGFSLAGSGAALTTAREACMKELKYAETGDLSLAFGVAEELADHLSGEGICADCEEELEDFYGLMEDMRRQHSQPRASHPQEGDFVISKLGLMVHKNCLAPSRFAFDPVDAFDKAIMKGMACLVEGEEYFGDPANASDGIGKTSTKHSIFPRFRSYISRNSSGEAQVPFSYYDSCDRFGAQEFFVENMKPDCEVIGAFGGTPKVFCEEDLVYGYKIETAQENGVSAFSMKKNPAYASIRASSPVVVNYKARTRVYNAPYLVFRSEITKGIHRADLESLFFHEMMHNLGYVHDGDTPHDKHVHNDYASLCEATCFQDVHKGVLSDGIIGSADMACFDYEPKKKSINLANEIREKIGKTR